MPVFDFDHAPKQKEETVVCTYTTFYSTAKEKTPEEPILVLDNTKQQWPHHSMGVFTNQSKRTAFEFKVDGTSYTADILKVDARFVSLIKWLVFACPVRTGLRDMLSIGFGKWHLAAEQSYPHRMGSCSL